MILADGRASTDVPPTDDVPLGFLIPSFLLLINQLKKTLKLKQSTFFEDAPNRSRSSSIFCFPKKS